MHLNYEGKKASLIFLDNFKQKRPLCLMHPQPKLVAFAAIPAFFCKRKWIDGTRDKESIKEKTAKYKVTTIFVYISATISPNSLAVKKMILITI